MGCRRKSIKVKLDHIASIFVDILDDILTYAGTMEVLHPEDDLLQDIGSILLRKAPPFDELVEQFSTRYSAHISSNIGRKLAMLTIPSGGRYDRPFRRSLRGIWCWDDALSWGFQSRGWLGAHHTCSVGTLVPYRNIEIEFSPYSLISSSIAEYGYLLQFSIHIVDRVQHISV